MTTIQTIDAIIKNTGYFLVTKDDTVADIKEKLATKFDSEDKKYGTLYAYFVPNNKLDDLLTNMKNTKLNDHTIERLFDTFCEFGFEILNMSLRQRINHETNAITLDTYPLTTQKTKGFNNINKNVTDTAKFIKAVIELYINAGPF